MGQIAGKPLQHNSITGLVVTLDALGTIYKFREPVGRQYLKIASECGLKPKIEEKALTDAFRKAFASVSQDFPNYGKHKLPSPQDWWAKLIHRTFSQVVEVSDIPQALSSRLYDHFSSKAAYELFPDVVPFVQSLKEIQRECFAAGGPSIVLGVITNSDPRVKDVLESLSLKTAILRDTTNIANLLSLSDIGAPWHNAYDRNRDFDFLVTSYDVDAEKPDRQIFTAARKQAVLVTLGMSFGDMKQNIANGFRPSEFMRITRDAANSQCIHIGDDFSKDFEGAQKSGIDALLLDRDNEHPEVEGRISSLNEAAMTIRLMMQESLRRAT